MTVFTLIVISFLLTNPASAIAGDSDTAEIIRGNKGYIEYLPGNMPLVISVPHGGYIMSDDIPERPCKNCAKHQDVYTIEIGLAIRKDIYRSTGLRPYMIINKLHRTRLDPNRSIEEAASGNKLAEQSWEEFQNFIESACSEVKDRFGKGLYIDLHGHRHEIQRIELGYLLSSEELQLDNDFLNSGSLDEFSSLHHLIENNRNSYSYSNLVRGTNSLGDLLEKKGYPAVPSPEHPFPQPQEPYFSGGFNITRHGSSTGGTIDGIQIEIGEGLRTDINKRKQLANDLASVIIDFLKIHYFPMNLPGKNWIVFPKSTKQGSSGKNAQENQSSAGQIDHP